MLFFNKPLYTITKTKKEAVSKGQPLFIHTVWKNTSEKNLRNIVLAA